MAVHSELFEHNLSSLKKRNPALADELSEMPLPETCTVCMAKSGHPVLKSGGITFHSIYDPVKEGEQFAAHHAAAFDTGTIENCYVYGIGFGYHIRPLLKRHLSITILEPDKSILRYGLSNVDLSDILESAEIVAALPEDIPGTCTAPLLIHKPTQKHHNVTNSTEPSAGNNLCPSVPHLQVPPESRSLDILVVSPVYGGSYPLARFCCKALQNLGHSVRFWDASMFETPLKTALEMNIDAAGKKTLHDLFLHLISEMVVASCAERKPDLILALAQAPLSTAALERFKESSITTAFWFVEDYAFMDYWKQYAPYYDFYFTIQDGSFLNGLQRLGVRNCAYLPLAADPSIHKPLSLCYADRTTYGSDISFMGSGYYNREKTFLALMDYDFKIWGTEWDFRSPLWSRVQQKGNRVSTDETVKIFNATSVNINLHSSSTLSGVNPHGDFLNPRTFEIASCNAFQLVDERSMLERHFNQGSEMITYGCADELRSLVQDYLRHPGQCRKIAEKAFRRVRAEHTYTHRMQAMLSFIAQRKPECFFSHSHGVPLLTDASSFYKKHPETETVLSGIAARGEPLSLNDIAADIYTRPGDLNYSEAIFLLLKEYQDLFGEIRN